MDDTVTRPRYARRTVPAKRKRKNSRETGTLFDGFMRQMLLAVVILVLISVVRSVNTPVTNYLSEKTKYIVSKDIDVKEVYTKVTGYLNNIFKDKEQELGDADGVSTDNGLAAENDVNPDTNIPADAGDNAQEAESTTSSSIAQPAEDEDTSELIASMKEKHSFITPVEGVVTCPFGQRIHPVWKTEVFHSGVDIGAEKGVPIKASLKGTVIEAGSSSTYGKYIKMEHEDGIVTLYGHCSELLAKKGQEIEAGKTIAKVGNTGVSVGTHLHFEIWKDGKALDPLEFVEVSKK